MPQVTTDGAKAPDDERDELDTKFKRMWEDEVPDERIMTALELTSYQLSATVNRLQLPKRPKYLSTVAPQHAVNGMPEKIPLNGGKILGKVEVPLSERHRLQRERENAIAAAKKAKKPRAKRG